MYLWFFVVDIYEQWSDFTFTFYDVWYLSEFRNADVKQLSKKIFESHELKPMFNNWFMNSNKRMPHGWQSDESTRSQKSIIIYLSFQRYWLGRLIKYFISIWSSLFSTNRPNIRAIESFSMAWKHSNNVRTQFMHILNTESWIR